MIEKFKILGSFIKDLSSETKDVETYLFVREKIANLFKNDIFYAFFVSFIILFLTYFITSDAKHFYYRYFSPFVILSIP